MMVRKTILTLIMGSSLLLGGTAIAAPDAAKLAKDKCDSCHGEKGNSDKDRVPSIASYSTTFFTDTMTAYREGSRKGSQFEELKLDVEIDEADMNAVVEKLSEEEITALGKYFAAQKFIPRQQEVDPKLVKKGEKLYKKCKKCHADNGSDPDDDAGILAGQWKPYMKFRIEQIAKDTRKKWMKKMKKKLKTLKEGDTEALLDFFASQKGD